MRLFLSPSQFFLFFNRQVVDFLTFWGAAVLVQGPAFLTLDEEQVAILIGAVGMGIAGFSALVALGDYVTGDAFTYTLVKNKVFPQEF